MIIVRTRRPPQSIEIATEKPISASTLYVANIQANTLPLATEFYIDLTVRAFNGTEIGVTISGLQGAVRVSSGPAKGGSVSEIGMLPAPRIKEEIFSVKSIRQGEFHIALEQRIPRKIAEKMSQVIDAGDVIHLGLHDLDIFVSASSDPNKRVRLPLWSGVSIRKIQEFVSSGRIIEARWGMLEAKDRF
jgi:hypothetical protein